jgi:hypothetical protein
MIDIKQQLEWILQNPQVTKRVAECVQCDRFIKPIALCSECGCLIKLKTKLPSAECPLKKW